LEVDGCEPKRGCKFVLGKTDHEMAALLVAHNVTHAINLDGGGSSTTVENGTVVNRPTNADLWSLRSERTVTTITCIE
jgi:exopolysaccharide biosynthesis protein